MPLAEVAVNVRCHHIKKMDQAISRQADPWRSAAPTHMRRVATVRPGSGRWRIAEGRVMKRVTTRSRRRHHHRHRRRYRR